MELEIQDLIKDPLNWEEIKPKLQATLPSLYHFIEECCSRGEFDKLEELIINLNTGNLPH